VCLNGTLENTAISDFVEQMNVNFLGAVTVTKGKQDGVLHLTLIAIILVWNGSVLEFSLVGFICIMAGFQPALMAAAARKQNAVLVNVNSFGGRIPLRNMAAYTASKFALAGFTDAIRPEFADLGIHVAQVHPGRPHLCFTGQKFACCLTL